MENVFSVQLTDDQYFLIYLVMGAYFAPDLKDGTPHKSALQRRAEGLPQYNANDLAGTRIKTTVMENVYYYVLRKADQSVVVKQPSLHQFIHGSLQFDDLFPPKLHRRSHSENRHDSTVDNVVFINNPETDYMKARDIERFKRLTGLRDFILDRERAMLHVFEDNGVLYNVKMQEFDDTVRHHVNGQCLNHVTCTETYTDFNTPSNCTMPSQMTTTTSGDYLDQGMIFLPSCPSREEWSNIVATIKSGFALTGSAAGHVGPALGLMDIGESEDSYLFRVSLPGVKRDERDFSCEVESDGTVIIKGMTVTGERIVEKYSQAFEMQSQNLCPPGPFSISFKLPGPVDPRQFHGTFSTDGILEGIAFKARSY
ncbi:hypothetical protein DH2020_026874 [Rehmannia glutinosa]|uniref:SHSP domain-containing protein n=1 Tax=Rehmannia glutinosa TaxID=99300 RepID=A0ABR0VYF5_REHGL